MHEGTFGLRLTNNKDVLTIRDNGVGISQVNLPKIFDKGYSGYNGRLNANSSGIDCLLLNISLNIYIIM